jgi:hypothetical protein
LNDQNKSQKSESLLQIKVNIEFFIVPFYRNFGTPQRRGQAEGKVPRSVRVIKIIQQKQYF